MPVYEKGVAAKEKLEEYESFMVLSAYVESELAADKWRCVEELDQANDKWERTETGSTLNGTKVSLAQVERERRADFGDLYKERRYLTKRIEQLNEQIAKMERNARVCSRVHTFLTGT